MIDPEKKRAYNQRYKKKHPEARRRWKKKHWQRIKNSPIEKLKAKARRIANYKVKIEKCEICCGKAIERHHPDYRFPLWIIPVCRDCHRKLHSSFCFYDISIKEVRT